MPLAWLARSGDAQYSVGDYFSTVIAGGTTVALFPLAGPTSTSGSFAEAMFAGRFPMRPSASFAVVSGSGTLIRASRAIRSTRLDPGRYEVTFDRDVSQCAYTATIGDTGSGVVWAPGLVFTSGGHTGPKAVYVETRASADSSQTGRSISLWTARQQTRSR